MRRLLLLAVALVTLFVWVRRLLRPARPGRAEAPRGGSMVRDRVCNTFVPRDGALRLRDAAGEHFFCSESCRDAHQARTAG